MAQQKVTIKINSKYGPAEREAIAQEVIDYIVERTQRAGRNKDGQKMGKYSSSYKKSADYNAAGKGSMVNLTLSGDMLAELKLLNDRAGSITIGYESGSAQEGKVEGNRKGTYGQSKPVVRPGQRDFLGISKNALGSITKQYPVRNLELRADKVAEVRAISEKAGEISGRIKLEQLEDDLDGI